MRTNHSKSGGRGILGVLGLAGLLSAGGVSPALAAAAPTGVDVRLSFKFILNGDGNRPATGEMNTDALLQTQVARANEILRDLASELRVHEVEIVDVPGISQWANVDTTERERDDLRDAARANPGTYCWRDNAINLYISHNSGTYPAMSKFPPDNDIIVVCQQVWDTTIAHEVGHSLSLKHTHEFFGDDCSDTLADNENWTQDDIATHNFDGRHYNELTSGEQARVDLVWWNLMSYHNADSRSKLSSCQMDRMSTQASNDRDWLLTRRPVYVDAGYGGLWESGTFPEPYKTIQKAINAGVLDSKVMVLDQGSHAAPTSAITTATIIIPRNGPAKIEDCGMPYKLPGNLEESRDHRVREAIVRAQQADRQKDILGVITNLLQAERHATGRERDVIRLQLAQRYRDSQRFEQAAVWFQKVADEADQPALRKRARGKADAVRGEIERQRPRQENPQKNKDYK